MIRWLRNAEGRPRWLAMLTWIYLLWSLLPVLLAVQFSFNVQEFSNHRGWHKVSCTYVVQDVSFLFAEHILFIYGPIHVVAGHLLVDSWD